MGSSLSAHAAQFLYHQFGTNFLCNILDRDDGATLRLLLQQGLSPNVKVTLETNRPEAPTIEKHFLWWACSPIENRKPRVVAALLEFNADVNSISPSRMNAFTPLFIAAYAGNEKLARTLISKGAKLEMSTDGITTNALLFAAQGGSVPLIEEILNQGFDVNRADSRGVTALFVAVEHADLEVVSFLLHMGANPNHVTCFGKTSLFLACQRWPSSKTIVELLLKSGADTNFQTDTGMTPLYVACENQSTYIVKLLINYNANPCIGTKRNNITPLLKAVEQGNEELVKFLLSVPTVEINAQTINEKYSPLYIAAKNGEELIVAEFLKQKNVLVNLESYENAFELNPNLNKKKGERREYIFSPIYIAWQRGHMKIVELLKPHSNLRQNITLATNNHDSKALKFFEEVYAKTVS